MKEDSEKLDRLLHEQLRALPDPPAPRELIPKVLQRLAAPLPSPWWTLPWLEWPRSLQLLSSMALAALLGLAYYLRASLLGLLHHSGGLFEGAPIFLQQAATAAQTIWKVAERMMGSIHFAWLTEAAVVLVALYLCILGVGVVFYRVLAAQPMMAE
jgi:hypothetical protein